MTTPIYHYGNGTVLDQIKRFGELREPVTLCGLTTSTSALVHLHTEPVKVTCQECRRLMPAQVVDSA